MAKSYGIFHKESGMLAYRFLCETSKMAAKILGVRILFVLVLKYNKINEEVADAKSKSLNL